MALALFQNAKARRTGIGNRRDAAYQFARNLPGHCVWRHCTRQRPSEKISEAFAFRRSHALRKLFHDYNFPDSSTLSAVDLGTACRNHSVRHSDLVVIAFWIDAGSRSLEHLRYT